MDPAYFTSSHRDLGHNPDRPHVVLDPFQTTLWDDSGLLLIEQSGLAGYIDFRAAFSSLELPALVREGLKFDMVYVDGSHLFEDIFVDFYFVSRLLDNGGVVLFDDCSDPHVRKVLRFIRATCAESFSPFDLGRFRDDQGKSIRYMLGGLLGRRQLLAFKR